MADLVLDPTDPLFNKGDLLTNELVFIRALFAAYLVNRLSVYPLKIFRGQGLCLHVSVPAYPILFKEVFRGKVAMFALRLLHL